MLNTGAVLRLQELLGKWFGVGKAGLNLSYDELDELLGLLEEAENDSDFLCRRCNKPAFFNYGVCLPCMRTLFTYCRSLKRE